MPKRKRVAYEEGEDRSLRMRKSMVEEKITQSRKALHRALKVAKGFERQKLGKRLTNAKSQSKAEDVERINKEIEVLKALDLSKAGEAHLRKSLLKIKAFAENGLLVEALGEEVQRPNLGEEARAYNNVTSGLFNMKSVKQTIGQSVAAMYLALGIPAPAGKDKLNKEPLKETLKSVNRVPIAETEDSNGLGNEEGSKGPVWDGFELGDEDGNQELNDESGITDEDQNGEVDEEAMSGYDALLGGSSDEESFDEEEYKAKVHAKHTERLSLSPQPSDLRSPPELKSTARDKPHKSSRPNPVPIKGSTFLPTLRSGYWEGSESSASDIEDEAPPMRKNRPGQMARQAIWEKKFGQRANHIKMGLGPVAERRAKDAGWDPKKGATDGTERVGFGHRGRSRGFGKDVPYRANGRIESRGTGENATAVGPRKRGMGKKDDVGVLHPSWLAAKKAKEAKKAATFQGKKVVFE
jgi:hypothetical protein